MNRYISLLLAACIVCLTTNCQEVKKKHKNTASNKKEITNYTVHRMPKELKEISGIAVVDSNTFLAIQDEEGILYTYDLQQEKIISQKKFADPGDFEDVALAGSDVFVVRSDGKIFKIKNYKDSNPAVEIFTTPLTEKNNIEGLAYDKANNRLLLASKDDGIDNDQDKEIFEFSLKTNNLNTKPVFTVNIAKIANFYKGDALVETSKKFLKALGNTNVNDVFRPSALAVHPETKELYVLSSVNNIIAVIDKEGNLKRIFELDGKEFIQPEGLAFTVKGELYVSNEGRGKKGNIIRITY